MDSEKGTKVSGKTKEIPKLRYGKVVRLSHEVIEHIAKHGQFGESTDDVLRRLFKLPMRKEIHHDGHA